MEKLGASIMQMKNTLSSLTSLFLESWTFSGTPEMTWQMAMGISRTHGSSDLSEQSAAGSCVNKVFSCDQLPQLQSLPSCIFMPTSSSPFPLSWSFSPPFPSAKDLTRLASLPCPSAHFTVSSFLLSTWWLGWSVVFPPCSTHQKEIIQVRPGPINYEPYTVLESWREVCVYN